MKIYKVYFNNDYCSWAFLNKGYIQFPNYKNEQYNKRNEFNSRLIKNENKIPRINTFCENETEKSLFFFLDLFDALKYISYFNNKFGNFDNQSLEFKILELNLPYGLILKYLGIGNYEFERECGYNLALEVAIPFEELQKLMQKSLYDKELIQLDNAKIYDMNDDIIVKALEYLSINPDFKSQNYTQGIENILHILGFKIILGTIYKNPSTGKLKFIQDKPQYKSFLLNEILKKISNEIDENMDKYNNKKNL